MYNAPSVIYPVGRCAFARRLFAVWVLVMVATLVLWAWQQTVSVVWYAALALSLLALGWGWRCVSSSGLSLVWDGQAWGLSEESGSVLHLGKPVYITLDLQHTLLLQWMALSTHDKPKTQWLWLSESTAPANWQNLRRALYSDEHLS